MLVSITDIGAQLYVSPEDRKAYRRILEERGVVEGFEAPVYRKDGAVIWTSTSARAVRDESGNIVRFEGTAEDITVRREAEEDLRKTMDRLRKSLAGTIQAMSLTVETRDPYTAGHQRRVSALARALAQAMDFPANMIDAIRMAGAIHDIGKMSVPAEILSKPGHLSAIERRLIEAHSQKGYDILKDVGLPFPVAEIVLQHHERLDGSGYPQGLRGNQILPEAQILIVADVVEAISSHRPYRPAHGIDIALGEIEANKGILYNAEIVDACLRLFRQQGFRFDEPE
jgi:putative nucleotidyltransferase with HDIG domain